MDPVARPTRDVCPWYEVVLDGKISQGDLLPRFALAAITSDYESVVQGNGEYGYDYADVVILTQTCDIENAKTDNIVVCPYWTKADSGLSNSNLGLCRKGQLQGFHLLPPCQLFDYTEAARVVSFIEVHTVPKGHILSHVETLPERIRLQSPYREHLAQAFGMFFSRVAKNKDYD